MAKVTKKQTIKTPNGVVLETFFGVENSDYIDMKGTGKNLTQTLGGLSFFLDEEQSVLKIESSKSQNA